MSWRLALAKHPIEPIPIGPAILRLELMSNSRRNAFADNLQQPLRAEAGARAGWLRFLIDTPALALLITTAVYLRCVNNEFVYDDKDMIVRNPFIGDWAMVLKSFGRDLFWFVNPNHRQSVYYRPLQDVWLSLNYHLFGFAVPGWHLALIAVHLIAVWLVFEIARDLSDARWTPLLAASLFGVMPIHAQAVVWPVAIPLPMSAAFELGAFLCHLRGDRRGGIRRLAALALYALALLSHESAAAFPFLIVAYSVIVEPERDAHSGRASLEGMARRVTIEAWPYFAVLAGYLVLRFWALGLISEKHFLNPMTSTQLLLTLPAALAKYLGMLTTPWSPEPEHPLAIVTSVSSSDFYLPVAMLTALAFGIVLVLPKTPRPRLYLFCIAWIGVGLLPVLNLREFAASAMIEDRYLYLSSVGWCLMLAEIVFAIFARLDLATVGVAAGATALTALYGGFLFHVEAYWHDDVALFSTCLQTAPNSWLCHRELASALKIRGDIDGAEREYRNALAIEPENPSVLLNLAALLEQKRQYAEALDDMKRALVTMPQWKFLPAEYANIANSADILGDPALRDSALAVGTTVPGGPLAVAKARAEMDMRHHDFADAETLMLATSVKEPGDAEVWALLATALAREGKTSQAIDACQK